MLAFKKRVSLLKLHCGYVVPKWYGYAYHPSSCRMYVYYLKPLHLFARYLKRLWDNVIWFLMDFMWHFGVEVLYGKPEVVKKRCREKKCWDEWNKLGNYSLMRYDRLFTEVSKEYWRRIKRNLWLIG